MTPVLLIALLVQAAEAPIPFCGSRDRDIGRGFELTQYMFDGASGFQLKYRPPAESIQSYGVTENAPFQLMFSRMDLSTPPRQSTSATGPNVGYANYQFTKPDGVRLGTGTLTLKCGDGVVLSASYSAQAPGPEVEGPISFAAPFYNQAEYECLNYLQRDGRFRFTVAESDESDPVVVVEGPIELDWALAEVERLWRADLDRAGRRLCEIMPSPPAPF